MTGAIQVVEIPIETTFREIRAMKIPDKLAVEEFTKHALKIVRMALAEDNFYTAIDTMDKTRVIEEYIKAKVRRNHAQLVTQNVAAAGRYEILWELGGWLDEHLARYGRSNHPLHNERGDKPLFWLDDLGIDEIQSYRWQNIHSNLTLDELHAWTAQFIKDGASGKEDELTWGKVWTLANPRPPSEPEPEVEVDLSPGGKKAYKSLKGIKKIVTAYFDYLNKNNVKPREFIFMGTFLNELANGLYGAADMLNKAIKENNENK